MPTDPAAPALATPGRPGRVAAVARISLGALFAATLLGVPQLADPAPVAAASCTGWTSQTTPPRSIKVLRTRSGRVETVGFRRYVAEVMASGEWPSRLHKSLLEAGAVVTKQYAWYYAMRGNHRPHYVRGGRCYDVRDDTADQLYRPDRAKPTAKQEAAIKRTWGLTLRKKGRFFLTGYRQGSVTRCGADANGWKLYARSAQVCARNGLSFQQILRKYLNPRLTLVWSDRLGPLLKKPSFKLRTASGWSQGVASLAWKLAHEEARVSRYRLQRKVRGGAWKSVPLSSLTAQKARAWVKAGTRNRFRVRAVDGKGRKGPWAYSPWRKVGIRGPAGITLSSAATASEPVKVKTRFEGKSIAFRAGTGPGMGAVKVLLNGKAIATVDLDRASSQGRPIVWARNFPRTKTRTLAVKAIAPDRGVDFEGFVFLR